MCNKLMQPFACGHSKPICTTPCPHALNATQQQQPHTPATSSLGTSLGRSDSTASSVPSTTTTTTTTQKSSLGHGYMKRLKPRALQRKWSTISLRARSEPQGQMYMQPQGPGFRFVAPAVPKRSLEAVGGSSVPATPASVVSNTDTAMEESPLPTPSTTGSFPLQPDSAALPSAAQQHPPAQPSLTYFTASSAPPPSPRFCEYYFPQYLVKSQYPCRECYGNAEWEGLRKKWVEVYRVGHPLDDVKDVERLSGVDLFVDGGGDDLVDK